MTDSPADSVVASYSTYLDSFDRTKKSLGESGEPDDSLISEILRPFKSANVEDLAADELRTESGLGLVRFAQGIVDASASGLIAIVGADGQERVKLLPIGRAALQSIQ
jgi:hypothetical protein